MVSDFALVAGRMPRNGVSYWEPTIDGQSLRSLLDLGWGPFGGEFAPVLIHSWPVGMTDDVRVLLGERPPQLTDDRVLIYVCSECGDLGCGAVSMIVERNEAHVIWRDFGWTDDEADEIEADDDSSVFAAGPFVFGRSEYDAELRRFIETFDAVRRSLPPAPAPPGRVARGRWRWPWGRRPS